MMFSADSMIGLSGSSQSCHEIMKVSEGPGSRDAVSQSSQGVSISSAQPKHNICPSSSTHPAVKTGQAQLQAAKRESGTTSNCKKKPQLEDGDPKKTWRQKKLKLSAPSPARYTQVSWFSEEILTVHKLLDLFYSVHFFASIQIQTNPDRATELQQHHKH